ncbi:MAG: UTP--glucose-1-phosphate uridylyltransferase [Planctomycetota bacterium]|jgi:UDP-N-acetylglucosamine/UDP-N-acetylgalactosamine diphosphorylase
MPDLQAIQETLAKHNQEHLLRHWDELTPARQQTLLEQIDRIDFDEVDEWVRTCVLAEPQVRPPGRIVPPEIIPARPVDDATASEHATARAEGLKLIAAGKVAAFTVAGGQGTRLGHEGPKGCLETTPVARKSLFQVFAEQIAAAGQRAATAVPWYVMTSPVNDVATRAFFRQNNTFGLASDNVFFFVQDTMMPAFDFDGRILLAKKGQLALSPDGHGGCLTALRTSGALADMAARGVEAISYFQVDNPLVKCVDPLFVGLHALREAEMSAKALPKRDPMEPLGNFCVVDGKVTVIEYSDMPEELARECTDDGRLKFSAGSIAIHILSRSFVERLTVDGRNQLPLHRAVKKVPFVNDSGNTVSPQEPNAVKLERFVFDAMRLADRTVILETLRREEFSPIKNATGEDSLATSLHDQVRRAAGWLEDVGIVVPRDADGQIASAIEISPLFADSADALAGKVDPELTITPGQAVYLTD